MKIERLYEAQYIRCGVTVWQVLWQRNGRKIGKVRADDMAMKKWYIGIVQKWARAKRPFPND